MIEKCLVLWIAVVMTAGAKDLNGPCQKRNTTAALSTGHFCQNKCKTSNDCLSSHRKCVCDGLCGASCVLTLLKCESLPSPLHGSVELIPSNIFNSIARYKCDSGYQMVGIKMRSCRGHGKWDGIAPICHPIPTTMEYSNSSSSTKITIDQMTSSMQHDNTTVSTTMEQPVTPNMSTTNSVSAISSTSNAFDGIGIGFWNGFNVIPVEKKSSSSSEFVTERFEKSDESNQNSSNLSEVSTNKGFCSVPNIVENSILTERKLIYTVGSQAEFKCNYGFFASSRRGFNKLSMKIKCIFDPESDATMWTKPIFQCREKSCSDPGSIKNGVKSGYLFTVGSEVIYKCNHGYHMIGRPLIFCSPSSRWSRSPPICRVNRCNDPEKPQNGGVTFTSTDYLSKAVYTCDDPFILIGQKERTCLVNETWSGKMPSCQVAKCKPPTLLPYGIIDIGEGPIVTDYKINFYCKDDGIMVGISYSYCLEDGSWSNDLPDCKVGCALLRVANGNFYNFENSMITKDTKVLHNERISLHCNDGFTVSQTNEKSKELVCFNGQLSPSAICTPAPCSADGVSNFRPSGGRNIYVSDYLEYEHNDKVIVRCRSNYVPAEKYWIVCQFGSWKWLNDEPLRCSPRPCTVQLSNIGNNEYQQLSVGVVVTHGSYQLKCTDENMKLSEGEGDIVCNYGDFQPAVFPSCVSKMCSEVSIVNGINIPESEHGQKKSIWCNIGYSISDGTDVITCKNGQWEPRVPVCSRTSCSGEACSTTDLNESNGGIFMMSACNYDPNDHKFIYTDVAAGDDILQSIDVPSGTIVKSRCLNRTYFKKRSGLNVVTCQNGIWIPDKPLSCEPVADGDIITPFKVKKTRYWKNFWPFREFYYIHEFIHSADGTIIVKDGVSFEFHCYIKGRKSFPRWSFNSGITYDYKLDSDRGVSIYQASDSNSKYSGLYECFADGKSAYINLKVVNELGCPSEVPWQDEQLIVDIEGTEKEETVKFTCKPGYTLHGSEEAICNDHYMWEADIAPYCLDERGCNKPDMETNSKIEMTPVKDRYKLGDRLSFSCKDSSTIQESYNVIQCTPYGWNKEVPTCISGCVGPKIQPDSNLLTNNLRSFYALTDRITFSCNAGYKIKESYKTIFCTPNGWHKPIPTCKPIEF